LLITELRFNFFNALPKVKIVIKQIYVAAFSLSLLAPLSALAALNGNSLTSNSLTSNSLTSNSLTSNALNGNALVPNAAQAAGMGLVSPQVKAVNGVLVLR
jgi:hypothetical protein